MPIATAIVAGVELTLDAGSPVTYKVALDLAARYRLTLHNDPAGEPITAIRVRYFATDQPDSYSDWETLSTGVPVAADGRWTLLETDQCAAAIEVELTSADGTIATLYLGGV